MSILSKLHTDRFVDRNAAALTRLGDTIFYYAELGMQEFRTSDLLTYGEIRRKRRRSVACTWRRAETGLLGLSTARI